MQFTAKEIAKILKGTVEGDENVLIWKPCKIEEGEEGGITFLANPKYTHYIYEKKASAIIVRKDFVPEHPVSSTLIRVDNPYLCVAILLKTFNNLSKPPKGRSWRSSVGRHSKLGKDCYVGEYAVIGRHVKIGNNVKIYPQVYIGDRCEIGDNTTLYAGVKLYQDTRVGRNCILHSGVVVGADGFGFAPKDDGTYDKIDQIGNVVIEDDVEIGANTCIDRATMGSTFIRKGVKIDNLCQLAHNVVVGRNTVMASQSGMAGSGKVGESCIIAGQVGIVGHIEVGDHVTIAAQSGVTRNAKSGSILLGSPAIDGAKQRRNYVYTRDMDALVRRIDELEKRLKEVAKE
ncbi:MAG: UDP-3-O-(3-hydroxymyristoyl)glucosamine N-acyltransferase [Bacteroidales bacterium]|nr:UDP-3-O-(3-hydroxymyristoyl)glucosamine N-acyltransferase [Bacteroidales bacterium]